MSSPPSFSRGFPGPPPLKMAGCGTWVSRQTIKDNTLKVSKDKTTVDTMLRQCSRTRVCGKALCA